MSKAFQLGDSNRCRTVYEQILRARVPKEEFDAQKLNKHVSVGRCRMLAINNRVALPSYEALSRAHFVAASVPCKEWSVPIECKRFKKSFLAEPMCRGPCTTCGIEQTAGDNDGRQPMAQSAVPLLVFALLQPTHAAEGPESQVEAQADVPSTSTLDPPNSTERAGPVAVRCGTFGCTRPDRHAGLHDVTVGDARSGRTRTPLGVAIPAPAIASGPVLDDPFIELDLEDCLRDLPETSHSCGTLLQASHAFESEFAELTCPGLFEGDQVLPPADSERAAFLIDLGDPYSGPSLQRDGSGSSGSSWSDVSSVLPVVLPVRPELAASGASAEEHGYAKGDSNRCRNAYEKILRPISSISKRTHNVGGERTLWHLSLGSCRMLAIDQSVPLPPPKALSRAGFVAANVPLDEWRVPTDCKRCKKSREQDGSCRGPCETCQHA